MFSKSIHGRIAWSQTRNIFAENTKWIVEKEEVLVKSAYKTRQKENTNETKKEKFKCDN